MSPYCSFIVSKAMYRIKHLSLLSCVQTESNKRCKITYKVNVKTQLDRMYNTHDANHTMWRPSPSSGWSSHCVRWYDVLRQLISVEILLTSQTSLEFAEWTLRQTAVKTTIAARECHGAPTIWLHTPQDYVVSTDTTPLSFQSWDCHNWYCRCDDCIRHR